MANQQHIEWLMEGVEAWNARREREDFVPDLEGADIYSILINDFRTKDVRSERDYSNAFSLEGINLEQAILKKAVVKNTNLENANLIGANLENADFSGSNLDNAELTGARLFGSNFSDASMRSATLRELETFHTNLNSAQLEGADCTTRVSTQNPDGSFMTAAADFSNADGLSQAQLDTMLGDSETRIPEGLTQPEHWSEFGGSDTQSADGNEQATTGKTPEPALVEGPSLKDSQGEILTDSYGSGLFGSGPYGDTKIEEDNIAPVQALRRQAVFILETAAAAQGSANLAAHQIETALESFRRATGLNNSQEDEVLTAVAETFRQLASALDDNQSKDAKIQELAAIIVQLEIEIARLTEILKSHPSKKSQILVAALGAASGSAITATAAYIIGPHGSEAINGLWQVLGPHNPLLSTPSSPFTG